jgi:hypothetical protein
VLVRRTTAAARSSTTESIHQCRISDDSNEAGRVPAGYIVVPAGDLLAVRRGCESGTIGLVVIGYSLPPSEKRRVWNEVRQVCGKATPILELYNNGTPMLADEAVTSHASKAPDDFIEQVRAILR